MHTLHTLHTATQSTVDIEELVDDFVTYYIAGIFNSLVPIKLTINVSLLGF